MDNKRRTIKGKEHKKRKSIWNFQVGAQEFREEVQRVSNFKFLGVQPSRACFSFEPCSEMGLVTFY